MKTLFILNDPPYGTERSYNGLRLGVCGICVDARGITEDELADGSHKSSMDELTDWTIPADKVTVS